MPQGVPGDSLKIRVLECPHIHPPLEVIRIHVPFWIVTWKIPDRHIARNKVSQTLLRLIHQVYILDCTRLGVVEDNQSTFQVDVGPSQAELFRFSQACENRQSDPCVIRFPNGLAQSPLFLNGEEACPSCSHRRKLSTREGALFDHASLHCPTEYMPEEFEVVHDSLRCVVLRGKVSHSFVLAGQGIQHGEPSLRGG